MKQVMKTTRTSNPTMMNKHFFLLFLLLCIVCGTLSANDRLQPRWIKHPPVSQTPGMSYHVVMVHTKSLSSMTDLALDQLAQNLPQEWEVTSDRGNTSTIHTQREKGSIKSQQREDVAYLNVRSHGSPIQIKCRKIDSYSVLEKGSMVYTCYVLYQVADPQGSGIFENVDLKTSYGAHGLYSVLIPGASQFYKGDYVKGGCFLGGAAILAGGIVWTHSTMNSYYNLENSTHVAQQKQAYHTKAQNLGIGRNVLIGALGALYVYNVIDAFVAPGARRVVRTGSTTMQYSFMPTVMDDLTPAVAMRITF